MPKKKNSLSNLGINVANGLNDSQNKGYRFGRNITRIRKQLMSSGRQIQSAHPPLYSGWHYTPTVDQKIRIHSGKSAVSGAKAKLPSHTELDFALRSNQVNLAKSSHGQSFKAFSDYMSVSNQQPKPLYNEGHPVLGSSMLNFSNGMFFQCSPDNLESGGAAARIANCNRREQMIQVYGSKLILGKLQQPAQSKGRMITRFSKMHRIVKGVERSRSNSRSKDNETQK